MATKTLERCKGVTQEGDREKLTESQEKGSIQGISSVFRRCQGTFRVFSGCFSLSPLRVSHSDPSKKLELSFCPFHEDDKSAFQGGAPCRQGTKNLQRPKNVVVGSTV